MTSDELLLGQGDDTALSFAPPRLTRVPLTVPEQHDTGYLADAVSDRDGVASVSKVDHFPEPFAHHVDAMFAVAGDSGNKSRRGLLRTQSVVTPKRAATKSEVPMDARGHELLTITEVADLMPSPIATLHYWRHPGAGPVSFTVGRRVLYRRTDIDDSIAVQAMPV